MNWNLPRWVPLTNFFFKVFFRLTIFFFRNKIFLSNEQLLFSFLCIVKQKRNSEWSEIFWIFLFLKIFFIKKVWKGGLAWIFFCNVDYSSTVLNCDLKSFHWKNKKWRHEGGRGKDCAGSKMVTLQTAFLRGLAHNHEIWKAHVYHLKIFI